MKELETVATIIRSAGFVFDLAERLTNAFKSGDFARVEEILSETAAIQMARTEAELAAKEKFNK